MVEYGAFRIDYGTINWEILNLEGHPNITGSQVTAILLNWWILLFGGASAVDGLQSSGLPRLVSFENMKKLIKKSLCYLVF